MSMTQTGPYRPCKNLDYLLVCNVRIVQGDEEEEETDNLVNQVLDEIGINLDEQMVAAPGQKAQVSVRHSWLLSWRNTFLLCACDGHLQFFSA